MGRRAPSRPVPDRRRLRRPLAVRERQRQQPRRADRPARLQDQADPRPDPQLDGQSRLVVRHREQRVRAGGDALLGAAAEGPLRRSGEVRGRVQRDGQRPEGRPGDGHAVGRLAGADAAVQLGSRIDRQGAELRLGVLDVLQLGDGVGHARGQLDAPRSRLRRDRQLARGGAGGEGRQGRDDGRRAGHRSGEGARRDVPPAGAEVAARHRHRSVRPLGRGLGQAAAGVERLRLREDQGARSTRRSSTRRCAASRC